MASGLFLSFLQTSKCLSLNCEAAVSPNTKKAPHSVWRYSLKPFLTNNILFTTITGAEITNCFKNIFVVFWSFLNFVFLWPVYAKAIIHLRVKLMA